MTISIVIHIVAFPSQGPCGIVEELLLFFFLAFISKENCGD